MLEFQQQLLLGLERNFEIIFWKGFKKRMNSFSEYSMLRLISINLKINYER